MMEFILPSWRNFLHGKNLFFFWEESVVENSTKTIPYVVWIDENSAIHSEKKERNGFLK